MPQTSQNINTNDDIHVNEREWWYYTRIYMYKWAKCYMVSDIPPKTASSSIPHRAHTIYISILSNWQPRRKSGLSEKRKFALANIYLDAILSLSAHTHAAYTYTWHGDGGGSGDIHESHWADTATGVRHCLSRNIYTFSICHENGGRQTGTWETLCDLTERCVYSPWQCYHSTYLMETGGGQTICRQHESSRKMNGTQKWCGLRVFNNIKREVRPTS